MERKVEHKSVSRQVEEIKALSEDILEYRSIDVQKAWLRMERRVGGKLSDELCRCFLLVRQLYWCFRCYFLRYFSPICIMPQDMTRSLSLSFMQRLTPCPERLLGLCCQTSLSYG